MPSDTTWIILSLLAPLFWATSNVIDQFLLRSAFDNAPWRYTFLQSVFYLPLLILLPLIFPVILATPIRDALFLMAVGTVGIPAIGFYVWALKGDDASIAIPIFNIVPFIVLVGAWLFLGETITVRQVVSGSVLVAAAMAITWDVTARNLRIKTVLLMLGSCIFFATYALVARDHVARLHWAAVYFWYSMGAGLVCLAVTFLLPSNRRLFLAFVTGRKNRNAVYVSIAQSGLDIVAMLCATLAFATAPAASLVSFLGSVQPLYVIVIGGLAARLYPALFTAMRIDKALAWKLSCILVMTAALYVFLH